MFGSAICWRSSGSWRQWFLVSRNPLQMQWSKSESHLEVFCVPLPMSIIHISRSRLDTHTPKHKYLLALLFLQLDAIHYLRRELHILTWWVHSVASHGERRKITMHTWQTNASDSMCDVVLVICHDSEGGVKITPDSSTSTSYEYINIVYKLPGKTIRSSTRSFLMSRINGDCHLVCKRTW